MTIRRKNLERLTLAEMEEFVTTSRHVTWAAVETRIRLQPHGASAEDATVPAARQRPTRDRAALSGQGDRLESSSTDAPDPALDGYSAYTEEAGAAAELSAALHRRRHRLASGGRCGSRGSLRAGVGHLCRRAWKVLGDPRFQRLAGISASHIYNLRRSAAYRKIGVRVEHTKGSKVSIGERRQPDPKGRPGYLRVDTVHPGQPDGKPGVYHLNAVDTVTQWQVVGCVETISEQHLYWRRCCTSFPFAFWGFLATTDRSISTTGWWIY